MMDRFESMSVFVAVAEAGGFSAASRRLRMPLPTVSRKVSELENRLNVQLFTRSTRKVTITDSGRRFLEDCRRILDDLGEAERGAAGEFSAPRGELVITAPIVFGRLHILPFAVEFLKAFPDVDVELRLVDRVVDLIEERIDLAFRIGALSDSSLVAMRIGGIGRVVCASPAYLAKRGTPKQPKELAGHDCVTFAGLGIGPAWTFRDGRSLVAVPVRSRLAVTTAEAAIDAAIAGVGVTRVLGYQIAQAVAARRLVVLLRDFEPEQDPASFVYPGGRLVPLKLRAFLDFAVPRLKTRLQAIADELSTSKRRAKK